jgi:MFS family permease
MLPLLAGVIISASAAGPIVARSGRYRRLMFGAMLVLAAGIACSRSSGSTRPLPILWAWMFVTGSASADVLGLPADRPEQRAGHADRRGSSSVSFFQQVGGTVGLAITGTSSPRR